ncbi:hypothetical protein [Cryptosporangium sp. NPDC051539]|uniref:hypothetical protein n=1 Tax=Cryptosporangium sp. NPDC051539 TaxID=3363962 RepID=UPI0037A67DC0
MSGPDHGASEQEHGASGRLERRYRRLLRAYPAAYRAARGDELVDTYLDTTGTGRHRPTPRDAADVLAGGLRQHLRARGASGLPGGVQLAAVLALAAGSVLAAGWLMVIELAPQTINYSGGHPYGPVHTPAAFAWIVWLAATAAFAAGSGRWCRRLIASALGIVVVAKPIGIVVCGAVGAEPWSDSYVPSLVALVPHAALGVLALAVPGRPGRVVRWLPLLATVVTAPVVRSQFEGYWTYAYLAPRLFVDVAAPLLVLSAAGVAAALVFRRDARWRWVLLAVLPPLTLLLVDLMIHVVADLAGYHPGDGIYGYQVGVAPYFLERSAVSLVSAGVTLGVLGLAVAVSGRHRASAPADRSRRPDSAIDRRPG